MDRKRIAGMATSGAVVVGVVLLKAGLIFGGSEVVGSVADHANDAKRDGSGAVVKAGRLDAIDLRAGDCWQDGDAGEATEVNEVAVVPCSTKHNAQVVVVPSETGAYPAADAAGDECGTALAAWAKTHRDVADRLVAKEPDLATVYVTPYQADWDEKGTNHIVCSVESSDATLDVLLPAI